MTTSKKHLYRSRNGILAGVMTGLAEYFDHDPTWWRLGAMVFLVATGLMPGVLLYALAWLIIPLAPTASETATDVEYTVYE